MGFFHSAFRNALPFFFYKYLYIIWPEQKRQREEEERLRPEREREARLLALTAPNAQYRDLHRGKRCFILCNGPSVKQQDIAALAGELVFSVSNGYHHPDYAKIAPAFHCVPQITYGMLTRADVIAWFREMHEKTGTATIFLNHTEEPLVREEGLFPGRNVRYVYLAGSFSNRPTDAIPDISREIPGAQSVPIMCLMIAMYMGFKQIHLLGTDHDHFRSGEYKYFYEPTVLRGKDLTADVDGKLRGGWHDELAGLAALWNQYRAIRRIAEANGVAVVNSTAGGELDEFPRIPLEAALAGKPSADTVN